MPLLPPTLAFNKALDTADPTPLNPGLLYRVSSHTANEPYFGWSGANRFDDGRTRKRFGICYFGLSLEVAFAETVLHDEMPVNGGFNIAVEEVTSRFAVTFTGDTLNLLDLTGATLKRLGVDPSISTLIPYGLPQQWSIAIHRHKAQFDGFMYMSRHLNTGKAVALYDRAATKLKKAEYKPLPIHPDLPKMLKQFNIRFS